MIVLVGQTKGGVGKSMIAANLAATVAHRGRSVLLVDADRQGTCNKWSSSRMVEKVRPDVRVIPMQIDASNPQRNGAKEFNASLHQLAEQFDEVVVDCGGHDSRELRATLMAADVLIAPSRPTQSDLWGLHDLDQIVVQASQMRPELRAIVVLNMTDPLNIHQATDQAVEAVGALSMEYSRCAIMQRPTYNSAFQSGRAVVDLDPSHGPARKAIAEIEALFANVYEEVTA